jgi:ketosteroid isomerase-like protein
MRFYASDAVWDGSDRGIGTFAGAAATRALFEDWFGACDSFENDIEEVLHLGNGVVLAVNQQHARPRKHGLGSNARRYPFVWAKNLIARVTMYGDVGEGRAAADRLAESKG